MLTHIGTHYKNTAGAFDALLKQSITHPLNPTKAVSHSLWQCWEIEPLHVDPLTPSHPPNIHHTQNHPFFPPNQEGGDEVRIMWAAGDGGEPYPCVWLVEAVGSLDSQVILPPRLPVQQARHNDVPRLRVYTELVLVIAIWKIKKKSIKCGSQGTVGSDGRILLFKILEDPRFQSTNLRVKAETKQRSLLIS